MTRHPVTPGRVGVMVWYVVVADGGLRNLKMSNQRNLNHPYWESTLIYYLGETKNLQTLHLCPSITQPRLICH